MGTRKKPPILDRIRARVQQRIERGDHACDIAQYVLSNGAIFGITDQLEVDLPVQVRYHMQMALLARAEDRRIKEQRLRGASDQAAGITIEGHASSGHCHGNRVWQVGPRRARLAA